VSREGGEFEPSLESTTRLSDAAKMTPTERPAIAQPRVFAVSRCSRKVASSEARNITKDDVVDADAIRERCRAFGILGLMAHSHADIGIVTDGDHNATFIVANGTPCRNGTIRRIRAPSPDIPRPRDLNAGIQVVNDMEDFVLVL